jgi:prepilin-type N-terminal cleavage/methylation domain-containing protein
MKQGFSFLEIIFVLTVMALIVSLAVQNSGSFLQTAHTTKIKTEVALIRHAIALNKQQRMLHNQAGYIDVLDTAMPNQSGALLFKGTQQEPLLQYPLIATSAIKKKAGHFSKESSSVYHVYLQKNSSVRFVYDNTEGTFECDYTQVLCQELQ